MIKRAFIVLLAAVMMFSAVGCGGTAGDNSSQKPSSKPGSSATDSYDDTSSADQSSGDSSSENSYNQNLGGIKGDETGEDESSEIIGDSGEYSLWGNPAKYAIIIPAGKKIYEQYATQVQEYFYTRTYVNIPIKTDSVAASEFEILIGKTNRSESNKSIKDTDYEISVKGVKLVFDASNDETVDLAVSRFLREAPTKDSEAMLKGSVYTPEEDDEDDKNNSSANSGSTIEYSLWKNPAKYAIIIPSGKPEYRRYASQIQQYFYNKTAVNIAVRTDISAVSEYEILLGKTSRPQSNRNISEGKYEVSVKGSKLVFDAEYDAVLEAAINWFLKKAPSSDAQATYKGDVGLKSTVLGNYKYVWGDEFEGDEVDFSKWAFIAKMGGTPSAEISTDRDVIDVKDGRLVLRSILHPTSPIKQYKMPVSVVTQRNMMYTYGYCEIKAKVPCFTGAWPSFWTQSATGIGERRCFDYFVEVDIFEVFGSPAGNVVSNIHKWYANNPIKHTQWSKKKDTWFAPNRDTINNEYHVYGYQWTPTEMAMYVDGEKIMTYDITESYDSVEDMSGFHDPQYIIFNNHLFTEDASWKPNTITGHQNLLPSVYEIEYFRLYQKPGEGRLWTDTKVYARYPNR